jgi:Fe2+ or Zn2+ uptake regulation protein
MNLHEEALARLRAIDQRYTRGRRQLLEAFAAEDRPLTVPEVAAAESIPPSSAYRNVLVLVEAGVLQRVVGADEHARFELAEPFGDHHHHLICSDCGSVQDVPAHVPLEQAVGMAAKKIARATGFVVDSHRVDLVGRCADCA